MQHEVLMGPELQPDLEQDLVVFGFTNLGNNQHFTGEVGWVSSLANYPKRTVHPKQLSQRTDEQTASFCIETHGL